MNFKTIFSSFICKFVVLRHYDLDGRIFIYSNTVFIIQMFHQGFNEGLGQGEWGEGLILSFLIKEMGYF